MKNLILIVMTLFSALSINAQNPLGTITMCYDETGVISTSYTECSVNNFYWGKYPNPIFLRELFNEGDTLVTACAGNFNNDTLILHLISKPKICLVTSNIELNKMMIVVDPSTMIGFDSTDVRRSDGLIVGTIINDGIHDFVIDSTSDFSHAYTYELDGFCGQSKQHTSVFLYPTTNGTLQWDSYLVDGSSDTSLNNVNIYRRLSDTLEFDTVVVNQNIGTGWVDLSYQSGASYFIEIIKDGGCNSSVGKTESASINIRSNVNNLTVGIRENQLDKIKMVNPSDGLHLYSDSKVNVIVSSMITGQIVKYVPNVNAVDINLEVGAYAIDISDGCNRSVKKLLVIE